MAHHRGNTSIPVWDMTVMMGIMVATKGMLSRMAERMAEAHSSASMSNTTSPPVTETSHWPIMVMTPVCSIAPTTMKSPRKNPMVPHSTPSIATSRSHREMSNMMAAAVSAMTEDSRPSTPCIMKAMVTSTIMTRLLLNRGLSLMASCSESAMTSCTSFSATFRLRPKRNLKMMIATARMMTTTGAS